MHRKDILKIKHIGHFQNIFLQNNIVQYHLTNVYLFANQSIGTSNDNFCAIMLNYIMLN